MLNIDPLSGPGGVKKVEVWLGWNRVHRIKQSINPCFAGQGPVRCGGASVCVRTRKGVRRGYNRLKNAQGGPLKTYIGVGMLNIDPLSGPGGVKKLEVWVGVESGSPHWTE